MALSNITAPTPVANGSAVTTGTWNSADSQLWQDLVTLRSDVSTHLNNPISSNTIRPESGSTVSLIPTASLVATSIDSGGAHFDIRAFGAVHNSDSYAAIQNAIFHIETRGGGRLRLPKGTWVLSSGLTVKASTADAIIIEGEGMRDTVLSCQASALTALTVGASDSNTNYVELRGFTITGENVSDKTGCALHLMRPQRVKVTDINLEDFDGADGCGLYVEGNQAAETPHAWRSLYERITTATVRRGAVLANADENTFIDCNFGLKTGLTSGATALHIKQGRNNRFISTLCAGESTSTTTGRPNYVGVYLEHPASGDNSHNQFYGIVCEGFDAGIWIQDSGVSNTVVVGYNSSINSNSRVSDGGSGTLVINPQHGVFTIPNGSSTTPAIGFSSEQSLGFYRSSNSTMAMTGYGQLAFYGGPAGGTTPGLALAGDPDTGFASGGADILNAVAGGTVAGVFRTTGIRVPGGSNIAVPLAFTSEASLGFYRSSASILGLSYGQLGFPSGSQTSPSIGLLSDASVGFYRSGVSTIAISTGTFNLATNAVRFSMRTLAASAITVSAANTNVAVNEVVFTVGGASGASLAVHSGGTVYIFDSVSSAKAT